MKLLVVLATSSALAAWTPSTAGERVMFWSAVVVATGALIEAMRRLGRRLWRAGRWMLTKARWIRSEVKEEFERRRRVDELLEREFGNGGKSMKDHTKLLPEINGKLASLGKSIDRVRNDVAASQHATGVVLDTLNDQAAAEHAALWHALGEHGIPDPRKPPDSEESTT